jgi:hypothetical protein
MAERRAGCEDSKRTYERRELRCNFQTATNNNGYYRNDSSRFYLFSLGAIVNKFGALSVLSSRAGHSCRLGILP